MYPARNGVVDSNGRREFQNLLKAPREVKSVSVLGSDALRDATRGMSSELLHELASKLP